MNSRTVHSYLTAAFRFRDLVIGLSASKESGLEANADKTKYMVMSRDQNAGRSHNMKIHNSSIERVE